MPTSEEQSLDDNVVFQPVHVSSPEFLHSETERKAVERLLSAGPEAFYSSVGTEYSGCFLSPEEVSLMNSWAEDFRFSQPRAQREESGEEGYSEKADFSSTYDPPYSDTPPPSLELGWPDQLPWVQRTEGVSVYTSPPAEGEPPVREVIRRHLQRAREVIAIVTDRLTDGAIIGDLHNAAFRGCPVYIILNQRSIEENFTLNRLRHPNIQVRVLGGKTFCSSTGRMVVGELRDKFILVDLKTVIHGNYSLTWTDAHLHRQLITVLDGSVAETFDKEFRILFAASLPVSDMWRAAGTHVDVTHQLKDFPEYSVPKRFPLKDFSEYSSPKRFALKQEISNPPSPTYDSPLDWEAMGVHRKNFNDSLVDRDEGIMARRASLQNDLLFDKKKPTLDIFALNGYETAYTRRRIYDNTSPEIYNIPDTLRTFNDTQQAPPKYSCRVESKTQQVISRQLCEEPSTVLDDRTTTRFDDKGSKPVQNTNIPRRKERSRMEPVSVTDDTMDATGSDFMNTPSHRKPIILRVPQSESFSSLSDIMKRLQPQSAAGKLRRGLKSAKSEMSQSMMDLSLASADTNQDERIPVPRLNTNSFNQDQLTPAVRLMQKRNNDIKSTLYRTPKVFVPRDRPRSSSYTPDITWRSPGARKGEEK